MPANTLKSCYAPVDRTRLHSHYSHYFRERMKTSNFWGFFFSPKVVGAAFFRAFSAQAIFTLLRQQMEDGGGREWTNLSDKMCWRWRWFLPSFVFFEFPVFFLMKNESGVWTQLRTDFWNPNFLWPWKLVFFFQNTVDDFAKLAEWNHNFSS